MLHGMVDYLQRRSAPSSGNRGMIVCLVSWVLLAVMIVTVLARFAMLMGFVARKSYRFGLDDVFLILAAVCSVGQTASTHVESAQVLGQHTQTVSMDQIVIFEKAQYVNQILFIANLGFARISVCLLIKRLLPGLVPKFSAVCFALFTSIWTVTGIVVSAFSCRMPTPWNFIAIDTCFNMQMFMNYIGISNIIVETLLILIPLSVWNLRLTAGRRASVSFVFTSRLLIVVVVAGELHFYNRHKNSLDFTYTYWTTALCYQVAQNLSVITACLPCLHPFIVQILSGVVKTEGLVFEHKSRTTALLKRCLNKTPYFNFNCLDSSTSTNEPMRDSGNYCAPLATYGLDRSSAHLNSQHFNRFPSNVALPIKEPAAPENVFNRSVEIPQTRPPTATTSTSPKNPNFQMPKTLSEVGVLPVIDWDSSSSDSDSGGGDSGRSSPSRQRDSEYIFNREKVISVPEAGKLYEDDYWRKYPPPPDK